MLESLKNAPIFRDLPPAALDKLTSGGRQRVIQRGETLFRQREEAQTFYIVLEGRVRLVQHTPEGRDVTMATFVPGDMIGLVMALFGRPYPGTAEILDDGSVFAIPGALFWPILGENPALAVRVIHILGERLEEAHNRIRELSVERVQQRIARALVRLVSKVGLREAGGAIRLDMRLSRQDIAQMTGTTLETVSRTLTAWERGGIIDAGREQIAIRQPHALFAIAEDLPLHQVSEAHSLF